MKRLIKHATVVVKYEFNIDIVNSNYRELLASSYVDLTGTEYDEFIVSMISQFFSKNYDLTRDNRYTHQSNTPGSLSDYYTFTKWIGDVQIIVVVNVRISDHPDVDRGSLTSREKRARYTARIANELSEDLDPEATLVYPLDITFDDQHLKSYSSAQLQLNSRLRRIEKEVNEMIETNNFTNEED